MAGPPSDTRPRVELHEDYVAASFEWGQRSVNGYARGSKERSRSYARPGVTALPWQLMGRLGECALCQWLAIDAFNALDWSDRCDAGYDLVLRELFVDVKTTGRAEMLIWPVTKNELLEKASSHVLVGARMVDAFCVELMGCVSRRRFIREHRVAGASSSLDPGTKYMRAIELSSMSRLLQWTREAA